MIKRNIITFRIIATNNMGMMSFGYLLSVGIAKTMMTKTYFNKN